MRGTLKKLLVCVLAAAMVLTSFAGLAFAEGTGGSESADEETETTTTTIKYTGDESYTITPAGGSEKEYYEKDGLHNPTLSELLSYVTGDGAVVKVTGGISTTGFDVDKDVKYALTLNLKDAADDVKTAVSTALTNDDNKLAYNADDGDTNMFCWTGKDGIYTFAKHELKESSITLVFPDKIDYDDTDAYGVKAYFVCSGNGEQVDVTKVNEGTLGVDYDVRSNPSDKTYKLVVAYEGTEATCSEAGTAKLKAWVGPGKNTWTDEASFKDAKNANVVALYKATVTEKDYGEVAALGHDYGEDEDSGEIAEGKAVVMTWDFAGTGQNVRATKDDDGNTVLLSVKVSCLRDNCPGEIKNEDAESWEITKAVVSQKATADTAGSTTYTVEVTTKRGEVLTVTDTIADIPATGTTEPDQVDSFLINAQPMKLNNAGTAYVKDGNAVSMELSKFVDGTAGVRPTNGTYTYGDNFVTISGTVYQLVMNDDGSIPYTLIISSSGSNKTKVEGTLEPLTSKLTDGDKSIDASSVYDCGAATYNYAPVAVSIYTGNAATSGGQNKSTVYVAAGYENNKVKTYESIAKAIVAEVVPSVNITVEHTFDQAETYTGYVAPTHYENGSATIVCEDCGGTYTVSIDAAGDAHNYIINKAGSTSSDVSKALTFVVDPTCDKDGYSFYD